MRIETKQKLDELQRNDRSGLIVGMSIATILAMAFGFFMYAQPVISRRTIEATVTVASIEVENSTGGYYLRIEARLDDGRLVRVGAGLQSLPPRATARIVVEEKLTAIWGLTYTWTGAIKP